MNLRAFKHFFIFVLAGSVPPVLLAWRASFHEDATPEQGAVAAAGDH